MALSSMWLWPLRHHWFALVPFPVRARRVGSVGDGAAQYSLAYRSCDTSSRASPPDAGTVQMSPPETNAISRWSGEMAGSENEGRAGAGACAVIGATRAKEAAMARRMRAGENGRR